MSRSYRIKEMFYSLQGEGAHSGRPAIFCRFSKCNLWTGREADRARAICDFCDTDFVGTDGVNGGVFADATALADAIQKLWPLDISPELAPNPDQAPWVVCTGGEPALQLDAELVNALHHRGFAVAIETNGTLPLPPGIDWVCLSPKGRSQVVLEACDELKLVFPQPDAMPERFDSIRARIRYLSPLADPHDPDGATSGRHPNVKAALDYCLQHPQWRLSLQTHKLLGIL